MTASRTAVDDQLRAWARGLYTTEAATALIIRAFNGRFATTGQPWIKPTDHGYWIDFDAIPDHLGAVSGGEQRLLRIAASIGSSDPLINLGDEITGLYKAHQRQKEDSGRPMRGKRSSIDRTSVSPKCARFSRRRGYSEQRGPIEEGQVPRRGRASPSRPRGRCLAGRSRNPTGVSVWIAPRRARPKSESRPSPAIADVASIPQEVNETDIKNGLG